MKNRLHKEIVFRSIYLTLAIIALLTSLGIFTLNGSKPSFDIFFFQNYWNLPLIMTILATSFALRESTALYSAGKTEEYATKHAYLRFASMTASLFGLIMGIGFVGRLGDDYLVEGLSFASVYPGIISVKFWTDISILLSRFICPLMYIIGFYIFDDRGHYKKIHSQLGIMPPTWFYMLNKIFGKQYIKYLGGAEAAKLAGKYAHGAPFFFYDDVYYYQKWWPIAWLVIFGAGLVIMNRVCWKYAMKERKNK